MPISASRCSRRAISTRPSPRSYKQLHCSPTTRPDICGWPTRSGRRGRSRRLRPPTDGSLPSKPIIIMPDLADGHFNLSLALLLYGQFGEGWQEYEWRWKGGPKDLKPRDFKWSRWRGQDLTGKRLLLHAEQGLGDT